MSKSKATRTETENSRGRAADAAALVDQLEDNETRWAAWEQLEQLKDAAIPAVRAGLGDGRWQIRRWCAAFLDHNGGAECRPWLLPLIHDPKSKVRLMAVHTLACDRCAGGENPVDVVPHLVERLWHDESIRVRRMSMAMLAQHVLIHDEPDEPDEPIESICLEVLDRETDRKLRRQAEWGLKLCREKRRGVRCRG